MILTIAFLISILTISIFYLAPLTLRSIAQLIGWYLHRKSLDRRAQLLARVQAEEEDLRAEREKKEETNAQPRGEDDDWENIESAGAGTAENGETAQREWEGVVGFFHPFCNAGGGGERVLWAAIRATQKRWPKAVCVVYTGDHDADKATILKNVEQRFDIHIHPPTIIFLYLSTRHYILSSTYPHLTLLGQSLGSLIVAYDAFNLLVPDILIDTMGYAFALSLSKLLFPTIPTAAYVHYPTISTDMLDSLTSVSTTHGVNAGRGVGWKGRLKLKYWRLFAKLYSYVGGSIDVVLTNSSWTQSHIRSLWGPYFKNKNNHQKNPSSDPTTNETDDISVLYPPCPVTALTRAIPLTPTTSAARDPTILYIAQFRPEKNHPLILNAFAHLLKNHSPGSQPHLLLIGSTRHPADSTLVYSLRLLAHQLKITDHVTFLVNAPWSKVITHLARASIGVNAMWNEHFGIGVVEYQAAGLISVVHDSGGPKLDIVVPGTGFTAESAEEFAGRFGEVLGMGEEERYGMRWKARESSGRFGEEGFAEGWVREMERLMGMNVERRGTGVRGGKAG